MGIKRLLIVSKLDDCTEYVTKNPPKIEEETADELAKEVIAVLKKTKKGKKPGSGRPSSAVQLAGYTVRASLKGDKIIIEGLAKGTQKKLMEQINNWLSKAKK